MKTATFRQARVGFELSKRTENKSKHTLLYYQQHLGRFERYLEARSDNSGAMAERPLKDITTGELREFVAYLQGEESVYEHHPTRLPQTRRLSPYTIRGIVATLSAFFGWAYNGGWSLL